MANPLHIGDWVLYLPLKEVGRIKSIDNGRIFVVYKCDSNWHDYREYTAEQSSRDNLLKIKFQYDK